MTQRIIIDPVTRIEGHAKITIYLDDRDQVTDARFHVTEFRGFERFCEGRPFHEMAGLSARICGICPVSHLLASSKAGDRILAVAIPPAAVKLRRLMNLAQIIQSHALSFFHLSAPDLLLGWESDPAKRNVFGLIDAQLWSRHGRIRCGQFGQEITECSRGVRFTLPGPCPVACATHCRWKHATASWHAFPKHTPSRGKRSIASRDSSIAMPRKRGSSVTSRAYSWAW